MATGFHINQVIKGQIAKTYRGKSFMLQSPRGSYLFVLSMSSSSPLTDLSRLTGRPSHPSIGECFTLIPYQLDGSKAEDWKSVTIESVANLCLKKMGHSRPFFSLFSSFQYSWHLTMFNKNFADDGIWTADLWCLIVIQSILQSVRL